MDQQRLSVLVPCKSAHQESASIPAFLLFKIASFLFQDTSACENATLQTLQTQDKANRDGNVEFHGKGIF
jgi:hypothetical protein